MPYLSRLIVCAAVFAAASTAPASSVAPNVQVTVKQGRTAVFKGLTDGSGRFTTPPLEAGVYRFELRALKTAPPAQYFLLLSGAKPVTAAMADKKAVLMMDAQVRRPRTVTGQVTARRIVIRQAPNPAASPAAPAAGTGTTAAAPQPTTSEYTPRPVGYQPRMINGRLHEWVPIAPGGAVGRWVPMRGSMPASRATPAPAAPAVPSPTPRSSPRRR